MSLAQIPQPQLQMKIGDTFLWPLYFTLGTVPDAPLDLTGYAITITIKKTDGTLLSTLTIGSGITVPTPTTGVATAKVVDTTAWSGSIEVQIVTVDAGAVKITYDPVMLGMVQVV